MTDNNDFPKGEGEDEKDKEPAQPYHPKHIFKKNPKNNISRSKSAPAEDFSNVPEDSEDYISSYNYFIYYNSIKPPDPRLPKPTYKPKPNLDYIKETKTKEEEDDEQQEAPPDSGNLNANPIENLTQDFQFFNLEQNNANITNSKDPKKK